MIPEDRKDEFDTSVRKMAILDNGGISLIQGQGLAVAGTEHEADLTHLNQAEFAHLQRNINNIETERKGDRLTIRVKGQKPMTAKLIKPDQEQ